MQTNEEIEIGPLLPNSYQYSIEQLRTFANKISQLRFYFTENASELELTDNRAYLVYRSILFDTLLVRAQILTLRSTSKSLLSRLVCRFLTCLDEHNAYVDTTDWFIVEPPVPLASPPSAPNPTPTPTITETTTAARTNLIPGPSRERQEHRESRRMRPFDPNKPSTSKGFQ